jgi:hypothetical protein
MDMAEEGACPGRRFPKHYTFRPLDFLIACADGPAAIITEQNHRSKKLPGERLYTDSLRHSDLKFILVVC